MDLVYEAILIQLFLERWLREQLLARIINMGIIMLALSFVKSFNNLLRKIHSKNYL
jgi:hypothetical protein